MSLQLQIWNAKARAYESTEHTADPAKRGDVEQLADKGRSMAKVWRVASISRALKPKYVGPRHSGYDRSVETVQRDYLLWAQAKGLTHITAYNNRPPQNFAADTVVGYHKRRADKSVPVFTGEIAYITLEAHFAVEESAA